MSNPIFLKHLKELAVNKIDVLLNDLGIDTSKLGQYGYTLRMPCPVHHGDNPTAFSINLQNGNWSCYTNNCHKNNWDILGLIKLLLEDKQQKKISFEDACNWLCKKLDIIPSNEKISDEDLDIFHFVKKQKTNNKIQPVIKNEFKPFPFSFLKQKLKVSEYFLNKGFSKKTLEKFGVGYCNDPKKIMYMRSYVPILDDNYVIGMTGRIKFEECQYCGLHHQPNSQCPIDNPKAFYYPKWLHVGFSTHKTLYNLWNSEKIIKQKRSVIITESPKDVWKLDEAGYDNALAIFGLNILPMHFEKLVKLGVTDILMCLDNDTRGITASNQILNIFKDYFNIRSVDHSKFNSKNNISDLDVDTILSIIGDF